MSARFTLLALSAFILLMPTMAQEMQPNAQVVNMGTRLLVRAAPSTESATIGRVDSLALITVIGRTLDSLWLEVQISNGRSGWVSADFVQVATDLLAIPVTSSQNSLGMTAELLPEVVAQIQRIYLRGQAVGNQPNVFSKVGDSITVAPHMFTPLGSGQYELATFSYLQETLNHYLSGTAREGNPFTNRSLAAAIGWSAPAILDSEFADTTLCLQDEVPLLCEYRLNRPSVALIMVGTNDVNRLGENIYYGNIERIVQLSIEQGVIPVLSTIPPQEGLAAKVGAFNRIIRFIADTYDVPLWDYALAMALLPNNGLDEDGIHPSIPARGVRGAADFNSYNLHSGYVLRNLTALQMLDSVWHAVRDI